MLNFFATVALKEGENEDAGCTSERYAIVCDGMGGRARTTLRLSNGETVNDSQYASRLVSSVLDKLFSEMMDQWTETIGACHSEAALEAVCTMIADICREKIIGAYRETEKKVKNPNLNMATTVACWIVFPWRDGSRLALAIWAGDSRCYLQDEEQMYVYSKDDADETIDAMQELQNGSPPLENRIGLDYLNDPGRQEMGYFKLHHKLVCVRKPALLVAATDGFYNLRPAHSPMHAEVILRSISGCNEIEEVPVLLKNFFSKQKTDDTTIAAIFVGPEDFGALRDMLTTGANELVNRYIKSFPRRPVYNGDHVMINDELGRISRSLIKESVYAEAVCKRILELAKNGESGELEGLSQIVLSVRNDHDKKQEAQMRCERTRQQEAVDFLQEELDDANSGLDRALREIRKERFASDDYSAWLNDQLKNIRSGKYAISDPQFGLNNTNIYFNDFTQRMITHFNCLGFGTPLSNSTQGYFRSLNRSPSESDRNKIQNECKQNSLIYFVKIAMAWYDRFGIKATELDEDQLEVKYKTPLSQSEADELKRYLLGETVDTNDDVRSIKLSIQDVRKLTGIIERIKETKRKLAESSRPIAISIPWEITEEMRQYVQQRTQYAGKVVREWYDTGRIPYKLELPVEMSSEISDKMKKLHDIEQAQEEQRQKEQQYQQMLKDFWAPYKEKYECWDQLTVVSFESQEQTKSPEPEELRDGENTPEETEPVQNDEQLEKTWSGGDSLEVLEQPQNGEYTEESLNAEETTEEPEQNQNGEQVDEPQKGEETPEKLEQSQNGEQPEASQLVD